MAQIKLMKNVSGTITEHNSAADDITANSFTGDGSNLTSLPSGVKSYDTSFTSQTSNYVVTHNLNTLVPMVTVYDSNDFQIFPDIEVTSANAIDIDFGASTSGKVVVLGGSGTAQGVIDELSLSVPSSDHDYSGTTLSATAGEALVIGDVCYLKSDGKFWKADASAVATSKGMIMVATTSISADASGVFLVKGVLRDDTWAWTVGAELFISITAGNPTSTQPSASTEVVRLVGYALSADAIMVDVDKTYVELA